MKSLRARGPIILGHQQASERAYVAIFHSMCERVCQTTKGVVENVSVRTVSQPAGQPVDAKSQPMEIRVCKRVGERAIARALGTCALYVCVCARAMME